jgi:signal transduction histidine kinase
MKQAEWQGGEEITLSELQQSLQLARELLDLVEKEREKMEGCLGLRLLQERVTQLQGKLVMSSAPHKGTYLRIEIPGAATPTPIV